jgi:hypothetical protein
LTSTQFSSKNAIFCGFQLTTSFSAGCVKSSVESRSGITQKPGFLTFLAKNPSHKIILGVPIFISGIAKIGSANTFFISGIAETGSLNAFLVSGVAVSNSGVPETISGIAVLKTGIAETGSANAGSILAIAGFSPGKAGAVRVGGHVQDAINALQGALRWWRRASSPAVEPGFQPGGQNHAGQPGG